MIFWGSEGSQQAGGPAWQSLMKFNKGNAVLHLELNKACNSIGSGLTGWRDSSAQKDLVFLIIYWAAQLRIQTVN